MFEIIALMLAFDEVLLLDADNIVLRDPDNIFHWESTYPLIADVEGLLARVKCS